MLAWLADRNEALQVAALSLALVLYNNLGVCLSNGSAKADGA